MWCFRKKQYKRLDDTYEFDKIIKIEKRTFKKYNRSNLNYSSKHNFYEYYNIKKINSLSITSKYPILLSFYSDLNESNNFNPQKESTKEKNLTAYDHASELYNEHLEIYFDEHKALSDAQKSLVINIILLIYFLRNKIMMSGLKIKNHLM